MKTINMSTVTIPERFTHHEFFQEKINKLLPSFFMYGWSIAEVNDTGSFFDVVFLPDDEYKRSLVKKLTIDDTGYPVLTDTDQDAEIVYTIGDDGLFDWIRLYSENAAKQIPLNSDDIEILLSDINDALAH